MQLQQRSIGASGLVQPKV